MNMMEEIATINLQDWTQKYIYAMFYLSWVALYNMFYSLIAMTSAGH